MSARMFCSCAAQAELSRAELAPGLPTQVCEQCSGTLVSMVDYRQWRERAAADTAIDVTAVEVADSPSARGCPACNCLMHRYRVGVQPDFRIDHCPACQLSWLDKGEWEALTRAGLVMRLGEIVSDAWQRRVQKDELSARRELGLRSKHGDECIDELKRVHAWLATQPQREELIALLRAGW